MCYTSKCSKEVAETGEEDLAAEAMIAVVVVVVIIVAVGEVTIDEDHPEEETVVGSVTEAMIAVVVVVVVIIMVVGEVTIDEDHSEEEEEEKVVGSVVEATIAVVVVVVVVVAAMMGEEDVMIEGMVTTIVAVIEIETTEVEAEAVLGDDKKSISLRVNEF